MRNVQRSPCFVVVLAILGDGHGHALPLRLFRTQAQFDHERITLEIVVLHIGGINIIDDTPGGNIIADAGIERLWISSDMAL